MKSDDATHGTRTSTYRCEAWDVLTPEPSYYAPSFWLSCRGLFDVREEMWVLTLAKAYAELVYKNANVLRR